jgi:perosamine synthetase
MSDDLPALLGGPPVRPEGPPTWPSPDAEVRDALLAAHADGSWGQYLGPSVPRLEQLLSASFGVTHVLTCATGTLAIEIALRAIGVGPGDEVILAAYEFEPTFLVIHAIGATPVLIDIDLDSFSLDANKLEPSFTSRTKAIVVSHLHGTSARMTEIAIMARKTGIPVIEDAAQACGGVIEGKPAGSRGDFGILSFGGSKLLSAGRGGALLTSSADLAQRARLALNRGIQQWAPLSELQAAVLIPQLNRLLETNEHRRRRVAELIEALRDVPGLIAYPERFMDSSPAYYKVGFFYDESTFGISRDVFVKALRAEGVAFDPGFRALHVGRAMSRYKTVGVPLLAESAGQHVVMLHHPVLLLGSFEIAQVAAAVWKTYRNAARLC